MIEDLPSLALLPFFSLQSQSHYCSEKQQKKSLDKKYLLPTTAHLLQEEEFAKVYHYHNAKGLHFHFIVDQIITKVHQAIPSKGDSIELFIDTRDVKTNYYLNQFCHYFAIFPEKVDGYYAKEITSFSSDDMHSLCDPFLIDVELEITQRGYSLSIDIPPQALYGFDPERIDRFGFNYRINRYQKSAQHFSFSSLEYPIERMPQYWASMQMIT